MIGKTIGEYQITESISETENAVLYKGYQPSKKRYVAVKVLKPSSVRDPAVVQGFLQQAELSAKLQHPKILPVIDWGQADEVVYQVSQFAETGTLKDHLKEFNSPQQALALIGGVTEGLEFIHSQGFVHANLKPSNIMLDDMHNVLLADIGSQQPVGASPSPYLAPEQVQGGVVDHRADVYGVGILLYEMLVGQAPPAGVNASLRAKRPDIPEAVERVYLQAVAQNPDHRFQSAREFQAALNTAVQQPAAPAPAPAPQTQEQSQPAAQPKQSNWVAIVLGLILVGILCGGMAYFIPKLLGDETEAAQPPVEEVIPTAPPAVDPPPADPPADQPKPEHPIWDALEEICSSTGLVGAVVVFGGMSLLKKRKNDL
jgi:serine/threonine-protein kinase